MSAACNTELGYDADCIVGMSSKGEVLLAKHGGDQLRMYKFNGKDYTEITSTTFPTGLNFNCWKEICDNKIYIQQDKDSVTLTLNADDLREESQSQHKGSLRGCLPQGDPVYVVEVRGGCVLQTRISRITFKPPTGAWQHGGLSVCCSRDNVYVTEYHHRLLDVFSREGNKLFLCLYCLLVI